MSKMSDNKWWNQVESNQQVLGDACEEYAREWGRDRPDLAWISTPLDTWEANPFYDGRHGKVPHPEEVTVEVAVVENTSDKRTNKDLRNMIKADLRPYLTDTDIAEAKIMAFDDSDFVVIAEYYAKANKALYGG